MAPFKGRTMLAGLTRRFSTIRWKLTGAFLAVSMLLALTMIAIFVGTIVYFLNAPIIPQALGETAREVARGVGEELANPEGSTEQLFEILRRFESANSGEPASTSDGPTFEVGVDDAQGDELLIALLDTQGRVITTTRPLNYPAGVALGVVDAHLEGGAVAG
jgi:hypothetical protein